MQASFPAFLAGRRLKGPAACEDNFDCERPMTCCDLLVARVCCSSGLMVGRPQPSLQGSLIPIPVEKDEPFPGANNPPGGGHGYPRPW